MTRPSFIAIPLSSILTNPRQAEECGRHSGISKARTCLLWQRSEFNGIRFDSYLRTLSGGSDDVADLCPVVHARREAANPSTIRYQKSYRRQFSNDDTAEGTRIFESDRKSRSFGRKFQPEKDRTGLTNSNRGSASNDSRSFPERPSDSGSSLDRRPRSDGRKFQERERWEDRGSDNDGAETEPHDSRSFLEFKRDFQQRGRRRSRRVGEPASSTMSRRSRQLSAFDFESPEQPPAIAQSVRSLDELELPVESVPALLGMSATALTRWAESRGQPAYRGNQIHKFIYEKYVRSLDSVTILPKSFRESDAAAFPIGRSTVHHRVQTADGTVKFLLRLDDGAIIETVGIPTADRLTVCVSSQVGCAMKCDFCATGKGGFVRDLYAHEIIDQVLTVQHDMARRVSHIVFMGMGEPLNNLDNVVRAVHSLNRDVGIGQRNITISTVGIKGRIVELSQFRLQVTLAVSLHAPNQRIRETLIPSAKAYPITDLLNECRLYVKTTGRRVSFEYTVLAGLNDLPQHAGELALHIARFQAHVNLIPYNPISEVDYKRPSLARIRDFEAALEKHGIAVSVRRTRGLEADAACGQLRAAKIKADSEANLQAALAASASTANSTPGDVAEGV